jgi:hypothetical protein
MKKINFFAFFMLLFFSVKINAQLLYEDFSGGTLPPGWSESSVSSGDSWEYGGSVDFGAASIITDARGILGEYAHIDMSDDNDTTSLITPRVDISSLTAPRLVFYYNSQTTSTAFSPFNRLILDYWNGSSWVNITVIDTLTPAGWTEYAFDISTFKFNVDSVQFRFSAQEGGAAIGGTGTFTYDQDLVLDEISIEQTPTCIKPSSLVASAITTNSASVNWIENGTATSWEVEYDTSGFTLGSGTVSIVSADSLNIVGLTSNTSYDVYVRAICAPADSSRRVGPITFTTPCSSFSSPFTEDFTTFVPACWDEASNGTPNTGVSGIGSGDWNGGNYLNASSNGSGVKINLFSNLDQEWIISPTFDLTGGAVTPLELVVDAGVTNWNTSAPDNMGSDDEVMVLVSEDNMMTWDTLLTWNASNQPPTAGSRYRINLANYTTNNNIFAIWATDGAVNDAEDYDFHIGNFELRAVPACLAPTALTTALISNDSVSIGWTENNTATQWEISYGVSGFTAGSGTQLLTISNPDTLIGLGIGVNTTYDFYVRSICGVGDTSNWSSASSVTTPCGVEIAPFIYGFEDLPTISGLDGVFDCWTATRDNTTNDWNVDDFGSTPSSGTGPTGPFGGAKYIYLEASGGTAGDEATLTTPPVDISGLTLPMIEFYYHMFGDNRGGMGNLYIDVIDGGVTTTIDSIINEQQLAQTDPWLRRQLFLPTVGDTIQVVIRASRGSLSQYGDISVDEFAIKEAPTCPDPTFLSSFGVLANSAELTWQDNASASSWLVEWDTAGYPAGTARYSTIASNDTVNISAGLMELTNYDWSVKAICSPGDSSMFTRGSFTTPANCPAPTSFSVSLITSNSASFTWNQVGNTSSWEIEYDTTGFAVGTGNRSLVASDSINIASFMSNTSYEIYVRAVCSSTDSSTWVGPISFTTLCVPFTAPYLENFDGLALTSPYTDLPGCWTPQAGPDFWDVTNDVVNTGHTYLPNIGDHTTGTGNYMWIDASSDITANEMETPFIDMSGLNNPLVGFWFASNNVDNTVNHSINLDAWDGNTWINIATEKGNFPSWVEVSGNLPSTIPTTTKFRIQAVADTGTTASTYFYNDLGVDDFFVIETPIPYYAVGDINKVDTNGVADSLNVTCFTSGTVAGVDLDGNNGISFTIIDQSSSSPEGISIFNFVDVSNYVVNEGDSIMVRGFVDQFRGLTQIRVDSIMIISTGSALPAHTLVTALDESTESQLIRMENLTVTNVPTGSSINIDLSDGTNTFTMRVDGDTDVLDSLTFNVGDRICSVNGIGGQFDSSNPFTSGYQIFPMRYTDVVFAPSVDLGPDTIVCDTTGFMLDAGTFASYMWSTGDTTQMITPTTANTQYIVTVMDANGCSATDTVDVTVTVCVGINEVAQNNAIISFFPNPNDGQFKLQIDNVTALNSTIEVVSINGQIVYTENLNINGSLSKDINLNVEKGLYFVRLINDNGVKVEKLIIK